MKTKPQWLKTGLSEEKTLKIWELAAKRVPRSQIASKFKRTERTIYVALTGIPHFPERRLREMSSQFAQFRLAYMREHGFNTVTKQSQYFGQSYREHQQEVTKYATWFRDALSLYTPEGATDLDERTELWLSSPEHFFEGLNLNFRSDAQLHPMFVSFEQHTTGREFWPKFNSLMKNIPNYYKSCQDFYDQTRKLIRDNKINPGINDVDIKAITKSLVVYFWYFVHYSQKVLTFDYNIKEGNRQYFLQLGAWQTKPTFDKKYVSSLILVHQNTFFILEKNDEIKRLSKKATELGCLILEIKESLSPDARLRVIIEAGTCQYC